MHCRRCVAWFLERQRELPIHIANLVETRDVVRYRRSPLEWAIGDHDLDIPDGYRPRLQDVAHHKSQFCLRRHEGRPQETFVLVARDDCSRNRDADEELRACHQCTSEPVTAAGFAAGRWLAGSDVRALKITTMSLGSRPSGCPL